MTTATEATTVDQLMVPHLPAEGVFVRLPWPLVYDSPFQYRKTHNEHKLNELAANIKETGGIHQPILARRRFPNPLFPDYNPQDGVEVVAGHRRKICGIQAGLEEAPLIVKDLNDEQVRKIQITENLQREDVHPIEEAEGLQALINEHNMTADMIATQLSKSRSYVYGRLKLLAACPEIRKACLAGEIGSEVTLLIARLRTTKLQEKALGYIKGKYLNLGDGGEQSLRRIKDLLNERFTLELKTAMFDTEDEMLLPIAGNCITCPKKSGNAPEFEDVANAKKPDSWSRQHVGAEVCTDPDCFDAKKKAHLKREAVKLEAKGKIVVDGNKARQAIDAFGKLKDGYIALKDVREQLKKVTGEKPQTITIQDPRTGKTVEAVKADELKASGVKVATPKAPRASSYNWEEDQRKRKEESDRQEAAAKAEAPARLALLKRVREAAAGAVRSTFDLQLIAHVAFAGVDYNDRRVLADLYGGGNRDDVHKQIGSMDATDVAVFALTCALVQDVFTHTGNYESMPKPLVAAAKHYGLDVEAIRAEVQAPALDASTPPLAARAIKNAKAGAGAKTPKAAPASKKVKAKLIVGGDPDAPDDAGLVEEQTDNAGDAGGSDAEDGATLAGEVA